MSTVQEPTLAIVVTPVAATEVLRFMDAEGVPVEKGGLRPRMTTSSSTRRDFACSSIRSPRSI